MQLSAKTGPKAEDLLEVEPLVCRVEERLESLKACRFPGWKRGKSIVFLWVRFITHSLSTPLLFERGKPYTFIQSTHH